MPGSQPYDFGPYRFDLSGPLLYRRTGLVYKVVDLAPKERGVLLLLIENAGKVVKTDELLDKVWPGVTVGPGSLARTVSDLRAILRNGKNGPEYIETVSKVGYRMIFPKKIMLAVLPFENLGPKDEEYFSDGLTEEMIIQLGRLNPEKLGVIARASVMQYKSSGKSVQEIGKELGVDYALIGSVRRARGRVRISAQLVRVEDQNHVWGESYDGKPADIFAVQIEVARAIAHQIRIKLVPHEDERPPRVVDLQAYDDYLRGRYLWNQRTPKSVKEAAALFEKAVAQDTGSAMAYSALADCYAALGSQAWMSPREASVKARAAARKAVKLDGNLAEPHANLGFCLTVFEYEWAQAEREFCRALELNSNYATAHHWHSFYLAAMGRMAEALEVMRRAQRIDPLSRMINTNVATMLYWAREREYDAAIEQCHDALGIDPDFWNAHSMLARALEQQKQYKAAMTEHRRALAVFPGRSAILVADFARTCALAGDAKQARELLRGLREKGSYPSLPMFQIGLAHAALGEIDTAFRYLRESCKGGEMWVAYIKVEPRMDALREDRRYRELLTCLGLR